MKYNICLLTFLCAHLAVGVPSFSQTFFVPKPLDLYTTRVERDEIDQNIPTFGFILENAPMHKEYTLIAENIDGEKEVLHPALKVSKFGQLMAGNDPFEITTVGMGPGEMLTITVLSLDGHEKAQYSLVPRPLEVKANQYALSIQLLDSAKKSFILHVSGFNPNEEVYFYSSSKDVEVSQKMRANKKGELHTTMTHSNDQVSGGEAYVKINGKNGAIVISYPWGEEYRNKVKNIRRAEDHFFKEYSQSS